MGHGDLSTVTKTSPATATNAHISIIAHITMTELLRSLESTEAANGFANRFLWWCARRSKCLPFGGNLHAADVQAFADKLAGVINSARSLGELSFSDAARDAWIAIYPELSAGRPGLLGAILARAEAQTLRLAVLYAALDGSPVIEIAHLKAALAVWVYAEQSAAYIFGDRMGDRVADAILSALRSSPDGLTRTQINEEVFSGHMGTDRIRLALEALRDAHLATADNRATNGRPVEIWRACNASSA